MEELPKHPHLTQRGGIYWLRRRIPTDLLQHYAPKVEFKFSLRTSDAREGFSRVLKETAKLEDEFQRKRTFLAAPVQTELSDAEITRLVALFIHERLVEDDLVRRDGSGGREITAKVREQVLATGGKARFAVDGPQPPFGMNDREYAQQGETLEMLLPALKADLGRGNPALIIDDLDALLEAAGFKLPSSSPSYRDLALAILRANVEVLEVQAARQAGEPIETPPEPPRFNATPSVPAPVAGDITFQALWEKYQQERQLPAKTAADFEAHVRRFKEVNGNLPVKKITRAHIRDFKDAMLKMPARLDKTLLKLTVPQILERTAQDTTRPLLKPRTVNKKAIGAISAVLGYAVTNDYLESNPANGIRAIGATIKEPTRLPYSPEELKIIFSSPVFTEGKRYSGGGGEAAKWLPLLALFTGARLEELGSLEVADVQEEQGVLHLFVHAGKDKSIKNFGSRRRVPLHPELIRLGFPEYVAARKKARDASLFPDLKSNQDEKTAAFSKWWGRYARGLSITDKRKVFHSFRHGVKRGLRDARVEKALAHAITGHEDKDVGENYGLDEEGLGFSLPVLRDALARLAYPGLLIAPYDQTPKA